MADLIYTRDNIITRGDACQVAIYARSDWSLAWVLQSTMLCEFLEHTVNGVIGQAQFRHHYGMISQDWGFESTGYTRNDPVELLNHWIRIDYTPARVISADPSTLTNTRVGQIAYNTTDAELQRLDGDGGPGWVEATDLGLTYSWYGVVTAQEDQYHGADSFSGDRIYTAMSLEYLLGKKQITESRVELTNQTVSDPEVVARGLPFNGGRSDGRSTVNNLIGNRGHKTQNTVTPPFGLPARNIFQFARSLQFFDNSGSIDTDTHSAIEWTITEMIDYLLYWYPPTDTNAPAWIFAPATAAMDDFLRDQLKYHDIETDGRTLLDIFNQLFDRHRGFTWWVEVNEDAINGDGFWVRVESYAQSDIMLADGSTVLPANSRQYRIDWSYNRDTTLESQRHITDSAKAFDRVVAMGAPYGAVFTIDASEYEDDWTAADETAYDAAHSGDAGYGSLDLSRRKSINDTIRNSDGMRHVYTRHKVDPNWTADTWLGDPVFPEWTNFNDIPAKATATATGGLWLQGRRFHPFVLLKERWDYTADPPVDNNPDGTVGDYLRPIVLAEIVTLAGGATTWTHLDRAQAEGGEDELLFQTEGIDFSCSIIPHAEQPGLNILPTSVPHVIGPLTKAWDGTDKAVSEKTKSQADMSTLTTTVYMTHDQRVQQEAGTGGTRHNQDSTLYIRMGERAHYDVLCPRTVLGISDDRTSFVESPDEYVILRDDRKLLQDIATVAAEWYAQDRNAIEVTHDQIVGDYFAGSLITVVEMKRFVAAVVGEGGIGVVGEGGGVLVGAADGENMSINSLISHVRHDFGAPQRTTVKTQFVELDYRSIAS